MKRCDSRYRGTRRNEVQNGLLRAEVFLFRTVVLQVVAGVDIPMPTPPALQGSARPDLVVHAFVAGTASEKLGSAVPVDVSLNFFVSDTEGLLRIDNRKLIVGSLPFCARSLIVQTKTTPPSKSQITT